MKSRLKRAIAFGFLILLAVTGFCAKKSVVIGSFRYTESGPGTCCASFYVEPDDPEHKGEGWGKPAYSRVELKAHGNPVLSYVDIDGERYTVTSISSMGIQRDSPLIGGPNGALFLPNTIEKICDNCFGWTDWYPFELPSSLRVIGSYAFDNCTGISLNLPEGVDSIGTCINHWNSAPITLPSTLRKVGVQAIWFSEDKAELVCYAKIPPEVAPVGGKVMVYEREGYNPTVENLKRCDKLYVPKESVEAYKNARGWNDAKEILPIPETGIERVDGNEEVKFEVGAGAITAVNGSHPIEVYTTDGRRVAVGADGTVTGLNAGLYIVRCGAAVSKIYIR